MADEGEADLVFVVDVSSFTKKGFVGSTTFVGEPVAVQFDDEKNGIYLTQEMARRLKVRKGSSVSILVENDRHVLTEATVASVGKEIRISDPKVYYEVGKEGGAIVRIKRG